MVSDLQLFAARVGHHVQGPRYRAEVEAEVLDHLEQATADLEAAGLSPEAAHRQAVAAFGDPVLIGRLLHNKGGDRFMKLARLGGICGILAGLSIGLLSFVDILARNYPAALPATLLANPWLTAVQVIPIPLFMLTLAGTYAHQPGSRVERALLLAMQMAGGIVALCGGAVENQNLFFSGILLLCAGMALAGVLLAVRQRGSSWLRSSAMVVAGLSLPFFTTVIFARIGHTLGYTFAALTTVAWIVLGQALLPARSATEPARMAN